MARERHTTVGGNDLETYFILYDAGVICMVCWSCERVKCKNLRFK